MSELETLSKNDEFFAQKNTKEELLSKLGTNINTGLSSQEVKKRLQTHGLNELSKKEGESIWEKIKEQFEDILVRILLASAVISFIISMASNEGHEHEIPAWVEPLVIFVILVANACVGIYQDYDSQKALDALQTLQTRECKVIRDSAFQMVDSRQVVPGDIIMISAGEQVAADIRVLEMKTANLKIDQSNLTGETEPASKSDMVLSNNELSILDSENMLYSSTLVGSGSVIGVIVKTGMQTEIGKVQAMVMEAQEEEQDSPLKKRLDEFGAHLANCIFVICILIWIINYNNFYDPAFGSPLKGALYYFKIAVALAVAAIPEGLPAVITTCLALGTRRMAKHRAIVRRLMSVETLGCTTVICSDKTGTLTTNNMTVQSMLLFSTGQVYSVHPVQGTSYELNGDINNLSSTSNIDMLVRALVNCNDSVLDVKEGKACVIGLPTEGALRVLAAKILKQQGVGGGGDSEQILKSYVEQRVATLEFSRKRKGMSVLSADNKGDRSLFIKGAPEYLIKQCKMIMTSSGLEQIMDREGLMKQVDRMAEQGLRVIAVGYKSKNMIGDLQEYCPKERTPVSIHDQMKNEEYEQMEQDGILIGFIGIRDPARPEVLGAIKKCQRAGINVIMITGDNQKTAQSIATDTGILTGSSIDNQYVYTGLQLQNMDYNMEQNVLANIKSKKGMVFSRTDPAHKRRLVQLLQGQNQIVAMTGDGTNDAPALKTADIGIAMGIAGTDVAKQASDMVLADDNFATIVEAVEEGRAIYANMKAFIRYMISSNIGEVFSIFFTAVLGLPDSMNSLQLLWVNLVTDGLPATALSFNPPDAHVMQKPPRKHDEGIITGWIFIRYLVIGLYVGMATVGIFVFWYTEYNWSGDGHSMVSYQQLSHWSTCPHWEDFHVNSFSVYDFSLKPCDYFMRGKQKASTLALSVLVMIEMLNALNALSEDSSIFTIGLFSNPWLLLAIAGSTAFHCLILYIPVFSKIFNTVPLTYQDWQLVMAFSLPIILIDECLKFISRYMNRDIYSEEINQEKKQN